MKSIATLALVLLASACGTDAASPRASDAPPSPAAEGPIAEAEVCVVAAADIETTAVRRTPEGLLLASRGALIRLAGAGCDLAEAPKSTRFAIEEGAIDVDRAGRAYVMPGRSSDPALLAPDVDGSAGVVRIDATGAAEALVSRGRWIGGFAVSPAGDELTVHGCAAIGLHRETASGWTMDHDVSERAIAAGGLDERAVAMGQGVVIMAKDGALLRVTAAGHAAIGRADVVFGGPQISRCGPAPQSPRSLARCGDEVCGVFDDGVAVWTAEGALARVVSRDDLPEVEDAEAFEQVTGDARGLYVLVRGPAGARLLFAPPQAARAL